MKWLLAELGGGGVRLYGNDGSSIVDITGQIYQDSTSDGYITLSSDYPIVCFTKLTATLTIENVNVFKTTPTIDIINSTNNPIILINGTNLNVSFDGNSSVLLEVNGHASLHWDPIKSKWLLTNIYGNGYSYHLQGIGQRVVMAEENGTTTTTDFVNLVTYRSDITTNLTKIDLNNLYPDFEVGQVLLCSSIEADKIYEYMKITDQGDWSLSKKDTVV